MNDHLEQTFHELNDQFDIEEPSLGHLDRFEAKLNEKEKPGKNWFRRFSYVAVAASIILLFGVWLGASFTNQGIELAGISKEMEESQNYFTTTIAYHLEAIEKERNEDTAQLINDALLQLNKLEEQYQKLTLELKESDEDKRVIYAMISNFQQRIEILESLLSQIEDVKLIKNPKNETYV